MSQSVIVLSWDLLSFFFSPRKREERKKEKKKRGRKELTPTNRFFETCPHISRRWWLFIEIIHVLLLWKSYQGIESLRQHSSFRFFTFKRKSNIILLKEGLNERERKRVKLLIKTEEVSQREGRLTPGTPSPSSSLCLLPLFFTKCTSFHYFSCCFSSLSLSLSLSVS